MRWRRSRRGLVVASSGTGDAVLVEHPRAGELPDLLADDPDAEVLAARLGEPAGAALVAGLTEAGLLSDRAAGAPHAPPAAPRPALVLTRSGVELLGVEVPARWIDRRLGPLWSSRTARLGWCLVVACGAACLLAGRPDGPAVSAHPWADALAGLAVTLGCVALHELAHAVALVHYGGRPGRAGFGFYWGGFSFYVDSTDALTLPRRARVVQALVGLGVDLVTTALLAIVATLVAHLGADGTGRAVGAVLVWTVAWRTAVIGVVRLGLNALPLLQVDGHWALADHLDEPDLAPRARAALGDAVRGLLRARPAPDGSAPPEQRPRWLVAYGAASLVGGLGALGIAAIVWWSAAGDLVVALVTGDLVDVVVGVVVVGPVAVGLLVSTLGLVIELLADDRAPRS